MAAGFKLIYSYGLSHFRFAFEFCYTFLNTKSLIILKYYTLVFGYGELLIDTTYHWFYHNKFVTFDRQFCVGRKIPCWCFQNTFINTSIHVVTKFEMKTRNAILYIAWQSPYKFIIVKVLPNT